MRSGTTHCACNYLCKPITSYISSGYCNSSVIPGVRNEAQDGIVDIHAECLDMAGTCPCDPHNNFGSCPAIKIASRNVYCSLISGEGVKAGECAEIHTAIHHHMATTTLGGGGNDIDHAVAIVVTGGAAHSAREGGIKRL